MGLERFFARSVVQITLTVLLVGGVVGLALEVQHERSRRIALVSARFADRAVQSAALLDDVVASSRPGRPRKVRLTAAVRRFLALFLGGLSATPGFQAAAFSLDGKLLAGSVPHVLRTLRQPDRQVASATVHTLRWRLVISAPRAQLFSTVGSATFAWLILLAFAFSTLLRTFLLSALARQKTQLEFTSAELKRTNTDLAAFASAAAHDIRGPLRRIAGFIDLVVRDEQGRLAAKSEDYLSRVRRQALRLDGVVEDLVGYARAGERGSLTEEVSLDKVVKDALTLLAEDVRAAHAEISVTSLPTVRGNEAALQQAMRNVLSNALKFVQVGRTPRIEVRCAQRGAAYVVSVRDWGVGIEAQYREKVFEPFNRLHGYDEYEGTGLGLATVQRIVERHGGSVRAVAPAMGAGTIIELTLPKGA